MDPRIEHGPDGITATVPDGYAVLFLAHLIVRGVPSFCAVYAPTQCLQGDKLMDAKAALFSAKDGRVVTVNDIIDGERHPWGGGRAVIQVERTQKTVLWVAPDECGRNEWFGIRIPLDDVLISL